MQTNITFQWKKSFIWLEKCISFTTTFSFFLIWANIRKVLLKQDKMNIKLAATCYFICICALHVLCASSVKHKTVFSLDYRTLSKKNKQHHSLTYHSLVGDRLGN